MRPERSSPLGRYIAEGLQNSGRRQEEIAAAVGIDASYLSRLKAGKLIPRPVVLETLVRELHLDLEHARQLAEAARAHRTLATLQQQAHRTQEHLRRQMPVAVRETLAALITTPQQLLGTFYRSLWPLRATAASPGEAGLQRVLVVDTQQGTAWGIPMTIQGPALDAQGMVHFHLHTPQWAALPEPCFLDVIVLAALPLPESVQTIQIGPQDRSLLGTSQGLEVHVPLPEVSAKEALCHDVADTLRHAGQATHPAGLPEGFAFRIRG